VRIIEPIGGRVGEPVQRVAVGDDLPVLHPASPHLVLEIGNLFPGSEKAAGKAAFAMRQRSKRFFGFWPFAIKSDIRAAEDGMRGRDTSPLADRFNSPV